MSGVVYLYVRWSENIMGVSWEKIETPCPNSGADAIETQPIHIQITTLYFRNRPSIIMPPSG